MNAYLHLQDGTVFAGEAIGAVIETQAEVVFSTGMTGYELSLTDPSFAGQIVTFTYPLIGNYGVPKPTFLEPGLLSNFESERIWAKGVIVATASEAFDKWLIKQKVPGISGIDTRSLTQHLRDHGVMRGWITSSQRKKPSLRSDITNYVAMTSRTKIQTYIPEKKNGKHLVLIDCGVKHGIIRGLLATGSKVTRIPWKMSPLELDGQIDGVVVSNGPGDPKSCTETVANVKAVLAKGIPYLGICLGHQILSLAIGADTYKLPFGHRGFNQPCQDLGTKRAYLTSQNHGYAVDTHTIPKGYEEWFVNVNDGTNEGIKNKKRNVHSVQFHPEGSPGPFDTKWIFDLI